MTPRTRPILFSDQMVRAIQAGTKTQTRRRIAKLAGVRGATWRTFYDPRKGMWIIRDRAGDVAFDIELRLPYQVGDVLWVRECWRDIEKGDYDEWGSGWIDYRTGHPDPTLYKWKPSIFMPKRAARLFLRVADVRIVRLQEISVLEVFAEGFVQSPKGDIRGEHELRQWRIDGFRDGWNAMHKHHPDVQWDKDPLVAAYTFEQCDRPEGWPA